MAIKPMFPDKTRMVRSANALFVIFAVAPGLYLMLAALVTFGKPGFARDPNIIPWLFLGLALFSLANIGVTVFVQTSTKLMSERARYDPIGRTYLIMATGAVLSEAHAIYGLVLMLLSGSTFYGIGFTILRDWIHHSHMGKSLVGLETIQAESRKPSERIDSTRFTVCTIVTDRRQGSLIPSDRYRDTSRLWILARSLSVAFFQFCLRLVEIRSASSSLIFQAPRESLDPSYRFFDFLRTRFLNVFLGIRASKSGSSSP